MSTSQSKTVLVIDPNPDALGEIVQVLAEDGFHIAGRISPVGSLEYLRRARPAVVLLALPFWEEGWGAEILEASPESVVVPVLGTPTAPWFRDSIALATGADAA